MNKTGTWQYARPVVAGWYWWQQDAEHRPEVVELCCDQIGNWWWDLAGNDVTTDDYPNGRWAGPLEGPNAFAAWEPATG